VPNLANAALGSIFCEHIEPKSLLTWTGKNACGLSANFLLQCERRVNLLGGGIMGVMSAKENQELLVFIIEIADPSQF
jgi:hypothetical protein